MVAPSEGTPLRILLVDDNIDHAKLAVRALRNHAAWSTEVVRLGQECLQRYADETFDLVLLDYRLPDMSGLEVLQRLRARNDGAQVILMTSQGSEEVAMQALDLGAAGYVVKNQDFGRRLAYEVEEWQRSREEAAA
jgi:CheY-like chemotaxis protein